MNHDADALLDLLHLAGALKQLPRQGWVHIGVAQPESVAEHSYRVALMTLLLAARDPALNLCRALTLAIVHDLPEAIAGDATPFDQHLNVNDAPSAAEREALFRSRPAYSDEADRAKHEAEAAALRTMTGGLPEGLASLVVGAWEEYEAQQTPEAALVRQADKLEALLQAFEYRAEAPDLAIDSFEIGSREAVTRPDLQALLETIVARFGRRSATP
jgi:putative hydrolase of HD superfamily